MSRPMGPPAWLELSESSSAGHRASARKFAGLDGIGDTEIEALDALQTSLDYMAERLRRYRREKFGREG